MRFDSAAVITQGGVLGGARGRLIVEGRPLGVMGEPEVEVEPRSDVLVRSIGAGYFETLGLTLRHGRDITALEGASGRGGAIVDERFAETFFPDDDPIGRRIRVEAERGNAVSPEAWTEIVGVAPTVAGLTSALPVVYLPYGSAATLFATVVVRDDAGPARLAALLRGEVRALDPDLPVWSVQTMEQTLALVLWPYRVFGGMFAIFAALGVMLSAVGLYAVTAQSVLQRTREIGVRLALGAPTWQVWWAVLRRVVAALAVGLVVGMIGALMVGRVLPFVDVDPWDPLTLASIATVITTVCVVACLRPARAAARLDPAAALRTE